MSTLALNDLRRLVVKIGSALLVDNTNRINRDWLNYLAEDVASLRATGHQVLIVSSGAVAIGSHVLGINPRRSRLEELQAAAAAGQVQLVHAYQDALARHDIRAAQVLLTPDDTEVRRRFLNARGTLEKLLEHDIVPVINENDTVATDELRYGDNDRLAARVAQTVMADGLILLSDVDGFYTADPCANTAAKHIGFVDNITEEHFEMAGDAASSLGSGGMRTKLQAARIARTPAAQPSSPAARSKGPCRHWPLVASAPYLQRLQLRPPPASSGLPACWRSAENCAWMPVLPRHSRTATACYRSE